MRRVTLAAATAAVALGAGLPAVARAAQGGIPSPNSCGYGNYPNEDKHVAYTAAPQAFECTGGQSGAGSYENGHKSVIHGHAAVAGEHPEHPPHPLRPVPAPIRPERGTPAPGDGTVSAPGQSNVYAGGAKANSAQAGKITLGPWRERILQRTFVNHDVDHNNADSPGDYFTGRLQLLDRRGKVKATVRIRQDVQAVDGSSITTKSSYVARLRGGHLYTDNYVMTQDRNQRPKVGDVENIPVTRGDGRFAGYTGKIASRVVKVAHSGEPTYADTITLTKQGAAPAPMALAGGTPRDPEHPGHPGRPVLSPIQPERGTPAPGDGAVSAPGRSNV
jgi:hypothetical protein